MTVITACRYSHVHCICKFFIGEEFTYEGKFIDIFIVVRFFHILLCCSLTPNLIKSASFLKIGTNTSAIMRVSTTVFEYFVKHF